MRTNSRQLMMAAACFAGNRCDQGRLLVTCILTFVLVMLVSRDECWSWPRTLKTTKPSSSAQHALKAEALHLSPSVVFQRFVDSDSDVHKSYLAMNARYSVHEQKLQILSSMNRSLNLPVRGGMLSVEEVTELEACHEHVQAAIYHLEYDGGLPLNFWHWTIDSVLLAFHSAVHEFLASSSIIFISTYPHRLREATKALALAPVEVTFDRPVWIWELLAEYAREQLTVLFHSRDRVFFNGPHVYPDPQGMLTIADAAENRAVPRGICIQRLYVGANTLCSMSDGNVAKLGPAASSTCQAVLAAWRQVMWARFAMLPFGILPNHPIVSFVVRPGAKHKNMVNEEEIMTAARHMLQKQFGADGFDFSATTCEGMRHTTEWFARSSLVVMARGACQANIPLSQNGAGILYIATCPGDVPALPVMPANLHLQVHQLQSYFPGDCNAIDFRVEASSFLEDFSMLLAKVHRFDVT